MTVIAYILGAFPVPTETFISAEIRALEKQGHTIKLIALHKPDGIIQEADADLPARTRYFQEILPAKAEALTHKYLPRKPLVANYLAKQTTEPPEVLFTHAAEIADYLQQQKCTHIHAHFAWGAVSYAIVAAKLAGITVSFTCHGSDVFARPADLALKCAVADKVIAVSPNLQAALAPLCDTNKLSLIPNGIDCERFQPSSEYHHKWLFIGRLIDCKGLDDIIQAWSLLPETLRPELDIAGKGEQMNHLQQLVERFHLTPWIRFMGYRDSSWIAANAPHYAAFISAFKTGHDGAKDTGPTVLKEAMAMGLPILTSQFEDIPAFVGDAGIFFQPNDANRLAASVLHFLEMPPEQIAILRKQARERACQLYDIRSQTRRLYTTFLECQRLDSL